MDGLSAAASVIAVTSLAFHLAESTKKAFDFWDSVQQAPEEIEDIKLGLKSLENVLERIGNEADLYGSNSTTLSTLQLCSTKINAVTSLTSGLEAKLASMKTRERKWGAVKVALKQAKIKQLQRSLDGLKATLTLELLHHVGSSYQCSLRALGQRIDDLKPYIAHDRVIVPPHLSSFTEQTHGDSERGPLGHEFAQFFHTDQKTPPIRPTLSSVPRPILPIKRTLWREERVFETFLGSLWLTYKTQRVISSPPNGFQSNLEEEECLESENVFRITPSRWLARLGFAYGLVGRVYQPAFSGPTMALEAIRNVPDDAPIFELCETGDLDSVQRLFLKGEASVKDADSLGRTPLYVSSSLVPASLNWCR